MKFQEKPGPEFDETETEKLFSPYIFLPCCILAAKSQNDILGAILYIPALLLCMFLGNAVICAAKQTLSDSLIHSDLITWFPVKVQKFLIGALSFICYFVLPFLAVWKIRNNL